MTSAITDARWAVSDPDKANSASVEFSVAIDGRVGSARRADTVDFEPVQHWTPEVDRDLWVDLEQINHLREMVKELVGQKQGAAPIETSEYRLMRMPDHFATGVVELEVTPCRVGLRRFAIAPNGDVTTCWFFDPLGNVARQNARDIWLGAVARLRREETVACKRACAYSCMAQKPFKNLVERGRLLIAAGRRRITVPAMPIR